MDKSCILYHSLLKCVKIVATTFENQMVQENAESYGKADEKKDARKKIKKLPIDSFIFI